MNPIAHYINLRGRLVDLTTPLVMGILNVTPDSFYSGSRCQSEQAVAERAQAIVAEGGAVIDLGAYSSRPDSVDITPAEELRRLRFALDVLRRECPDVPVSVDTFRADVARSCVEEYGVSIINDISGGELDERMFETVAQTGAGYILMHMVGTPQTMMQHTAYDDLIADMLLYFARKTERLRLLGVNDIIIDPGFGFSKTLDDNYRLLAHLADFQMLELPILAGVSRKSMIYRLLGTSPEEALNGTTAIHMAALERGARILRVHDVREAVETVKIFDRMRRNA